MKMTLLSSLCAMAALSSTVSGLPPVDSPNPFTPLPKLPYGFESIDSFLIPTVGDLDGDGDLDVLVGLNEQGLVLFRNVGTPTEPFFERVPGSLIPSNQLELDLAPALVDIDGDGDLDLFVGTYSGNTFFFRNTGTPSVPVFTAEGGPEPFNLPAVDYNATPVFADLNGDGLQDAIIGEAYGRVRVFNNIGTPQEPLFGPANTSLLIDGTSAYPVVALLDADGDTDLDILLGSINGATEFYRNTGSTNVPVFVFDPEEDTGIRGRLFADSVAPSVADWNGDGRPDLVVGLNGDVVLERNISTTDDVFFRQAHGVFPGLFRLRYPVVPAVGDLDGDGDVDALVSEEMFASTERPIITFFQNEGTPEAANFQKQTAEEAGFNAEFGDLAGGVLLTL
ncbi:MAG: VCBS repeat-containing protein, partial [Candidatus Sumerlaeia bacterium]|nr:VCBS repeat-containing protein [Candidatus Sumerlaeia bacterium]